MTSSDTHAAPASSALAGVRDLFESTDHKRIGRNYIVIALLAAAAVAVCGALVGFDNGSSSDLLEGAAAQVGAMYLVGLVFVVVVPLMIGIATVVVPLQVGSRAIVFGRLAATGFWCWLVGAILAVYAIAANGGPGGGDRQMVSMFLVAHLLLVVGLLAGAVSLASTILTSRAAGMNMRRVPPFTWSVLVMVTALVVLLPVLAGTLLYNYLNYRYGSNGWGNSDAIVGWVGFAFTPPAIFVYSLPAFGLAVDSVATATGQRLAKRGMVWTGLGLIGLSVLGPATQLSATLGDGFADMSFGDKLSDLIPFAVFNLLPILGAFVVVSLTALALRTKPTVSAPLLFGLIGALLVFAAMVLSAVAHIVDFNLNPSFLEGAWLLGLYGTLLGGLGAVSLWGCKVWGPVIPTKLVAPLVLLGLGGAVVAAGPLVIGGLIDDFSTDANTVSALGHCLMALTVLAFVALLAKTVMSGENAVADPFNGQSLEWVTSSPAPFDNFDYVRTVISPEPLLDLKPSGSDA